MKWKLAAIVVFLTITNIALGAGPKNEDLESKIKAQTQEMLDAIAVGRTSVWDRNMDAGALYTDENGAVITKPEMLSQMKPLPNGVSGTIKIVDFKLTSRDNVAIAIHVDDEHENYHGHDLHCQYRNTDTWIKVGSDWKLLASQVMAIRTDPPSIQLSPSQLNDYIGVYQLTPVITYEIRENNGKLEGRQSGGKPESLLAEAPDVLFVPGKPRCRYIFKRGADGKVTGFAERREAWDLVWARVH